MKWSEEARRTFKSGEYVRIFVDGKEATDVIKVRESHEFDGYEVDYMFGYNGVTNLYLTAPENELTNLDKCAIHAAVDIKESAEWCGYDWNEITDWETMLLWFGWDSQDVKEEIIESLRFSSKLAKLCMDDGSIEDSDGSVKSYRQLTNRIRHYLFK